MKVFGDQTTIDILPGQNMPHLTWGSGQFSIRNKKIIFRNKTFWWHGTFDWANERFDEPAFINSLVASDQ